MARYVIGIDLGTTNCALAYVDLKDTGPALKVNIFEVPQLVGAGRLGKRQTLPSFLYLPGKFETDEDLSLPWAPERRFAVGTYARDHGALVPSHLVSSAKSWLCHGGVDRTAKILPWGAGDEIEKVSPVEASARYLEHLKEAWNYEMARNDPEARLEKQIIILTVPASFDEVARELTLKAAEMAGLEVVLLEEPTAALYAWLAQHEKDWHEHVKAGEHLLVVDVGGGTSDFTVVEVKQGPTGLELERIAVGDHILLGGDNIDLALARLVERRLPVKRLDFARFQTLTFLCRELKEKLLAPDGPDEDAIRLPGRGRALIADTLVAKVKREEVLSLIEKEFFPEVAYNQSLKRVESVPRGMREWGLPYARESAITKHLAAFLYKQGIEKIDIVLFNGGALKPKVLRERICQELSRWFENKDIKTLETVSLDLAVAIGAAYYGLVKQGLGIRVGGGLARAYYLGIDDNKSPKAVCIAPKGTKKGERLILPRTFRVLTNRPVQFKLYTSSLREDALGDIVELDDDFAALPPLTTLLKFGRKSGVKEIPVHVEAYLSEVGVLETYCASVETPHRWRLQFNLRSEEKKISEVPEGVLVAQGEREEISSLDEERLIKAKDFLLEAFNNQAFLPRVMNRLEEIFEMERDRFPLLVLRHLADFLLENQAFRLKSAMHEARWYNLVGFFMRPGYGEASDPFRMRHLWGLYFAGIEHRSDKSVSLEWWIFWRRIAGGLNRGKQEQLFAKLRPYVLPAKDKKPEKVSSQERREIWLCVANMERIPVEIKAKLTEVALSQALKKGDRLFIFVLSRLLARELLYGPADLVVPSALAVKIVDEIMAFLRKKAPRSKIAFLWAETLVHIARLTGDRVRDFPEEKRQEIFDFCRDVLGSSEEFLRPLKEIVPVAIQERAKLFGETLPLGLKLDA